MEFEPTEDQRNNLIYPPWEEMTHNELPRKNLS